MNTSIGTPTSPPEVKVHVDGKAVFVCGPFNPGFVRGAKRLAGRWQARQKTWTFDSRVETSVRALCNKWYGTDGITNPDLVDLRLTYAEGKRTLQSPVVAYGRVIARAFGRDTGARLGDGIVLVQGKVTSSGSWKNWQTYIAPDSILIMHDVPRALVTSEVPAGATIEILPNSENNQEGKADLESERARLLRRVAELDAALSARSSSALPDGSNPMPLCVPGEFREPEL